MRSECRRVPNEWNREIELVFLFLLVFIVVFGLLS
jgi:hypothetical protein